MTAPDDTTQTPQGRSRWLPDRPIRIVLCVVVGVAAAAVAGAIALRQPEVHQSQTSLIIDQPVALASATDAGLIDKLARLRIKYVDLVPGPAIAGAAADELGLPVPAVASAVRADAPPLSLRLDVAVTASRADTAVRIANAVGAALIDYVDDELAAADVPVEQRYEFSVLRPAIGASQVEPTVDDAVRVAAAFGLLGLGAAYVFFAIIEEVLRPDPSR